MRKGPPTSADSDRRSASPVSDRGCSASLRSTYRRSRDTSVRRWRSSSGQSTNMSRRAVPLSPGGCPRFAAWPSSTARRATRFGRSTYQSASWAARAAPGPNTIRRGSMARGSVTASRGPAAGSAANRSTSVPDGAFAKTGSSRSPRVSVRSLDVGPIAQPRPHVRLLHPDVVMPDGRDKGPDERRPIECGGSVDGEHAGHHARGVGSERPVPDLELPVDDRIARLELVRHQRVSLCRRTLREFNAPDSSRPAQVLQAARRRQRHRLGKRHARRTVAVARVHASGPRPRRAHRRARVPG